MYRVIKISSKTTGQILSERESLLRVIRVIALIARWDDARATSRVDNESHGASAERAWDPIFGTGTRGGHRLASASGEGRARTSWKTRDPRVQSVPRVTAAASTVGGRGREREREWGR